MAAKKKMRKKKTTSLLEFRAWLEGMEEFQGDSWVPNAEQWDCIREKIKTIVEEMPTPTQPVTNIINRTNSGNAQPASATVQLDHQPVQQVSSFDVVPQAPVKMNPDAPVAAGQPQVKTPNIDTSTGEYDSPFE